MGVNRKILFFGSVSMGAVLIFCVVFSYICQLKEPVFLYHYYETEVPVGEDGYSKVYLTLYYITDISDNRQVVNLTFDEAPDILFYAQNQNSTAGFFTTNTSEIQGQVYGRYSLRTIYVYLNASVNFDNINEIQLSKANISLSDGEEIHTNLGKIILYQDKEDDQSIDNTATSSSSEGWTLQDYKLQNTVTLLSVDSPFLKEAKDFFNIKIDNKNPDEIEGQKYTKGSNMQITSQLKTSSEIIPLLSVYDIKPQITYQTEEGKKFNTRINNIDYNPTNNDLTFTKLFRYVVARGKL